MPNKIKKTQSETVDVPQGRDLFRTPRYAVDLLVPYIPKQITHVWECACGEGHITRALERFNYRVCSTDLRQTSLSVEETNFLSMDEWDLGNDWAIITNPPYSLKKHFYNQCRKFLVPFALLIPADYCGWVIDAVRLEGCEKIIPTRRIDFITPTGLSGETGNTSNYHSLWLTWGFGLGRSETFVELSLNMKKNVY